MEELNSILKKSTGSTKSKRVYIRSVMGGTCSACYDAPPSIKVRYDVGDDSKLVVYYCTECFDKHKNDLNKRLGNMNFT